MEFFKGRPATRGRQLYFSCPCAPYPLFKAGQGERFLPKGPRRTKNTTRSEFTTRSDFTTRSGMSSAL